MQSSASAGGLSRSPRTSLGGTVVSVASFASAVHRAHSPRLPPRALEAPAMLLALAERLRASLGSKRAFVATSTSSVAPSMQMRALHGGQAIARASPRSFGSPQRAGSVEALPYRNSSAACRARSEECRPAARAVSRQPSLASFASHCGQLAVLNEESAPGMGVALALRSSSLRWERERISRSQERSKEWLTAALHQQVNVLEQEIDTVNARRAEDQRRANLLWQQKESFERVLIQKREERIQKETEVLARSQDTQRKRTAESVIILQRECERDERILHDRSQHQQEQAQRAMNVSARRQAALEDAQSQELRRRKVFAARHAVEDEKDAAIKVERDHLSRLRRAMPDDVQRKFDAVKREVKAQRLSGKWNIQALRDQVDSLVSPGHHAIG